MDNQSQPEQRLSNSFQVHECPTSNIKFRGLCSITKCPANISHIPKRDGGCAYIMFKKDLGKPELSFLFKKSINELDELIEEGDLRIRAALYMERIMPDLKYEGPTCSMCFVARPTKGDCINQIKCNVRKLLAKKLLKVFPFVHPHFKFDATKLFMLGKKKKEITAKLIPQLTSNSISLAEALKIKKATFEKLENLSL